MASFFIGATAIVDPSIIGRYYPNRIVAEGKVRLLSFPTKELREFFSNPASNGALVEAALLHMIYADLIRSLRRHRKGGRKLQSKVTVLEVMSDDLSDLKEMLRNACSATTIAPHERRRIREHMEKHGLDSSQLKALLKSEKIGWTEAEWKDGVKRMKKKEQALPITKQYQPEVGQG